MPHNLQPNEGYISVEVIRFTGASHFLDFARDFLYQNETANELIIGYAQQQQAGIETAMSTEFFAVTDREKPVLAAMYTPDVWPTMTDGPQQSIIALSRFLFNSYPNTTGVSGPRDSVAKFVEEWTILSGCASELRTRLRIYRCSAVQTITLPKGAARRAKASDFDLIRGWRDDFNQELDIQIRSNHERTRRLVEEGRYFIWETDVPVTVAGSGRETENGITVGPVYTPPEFRRHGYATACVAVLTQAILDEGKQYASLYTDLDNPISNSIYQKIGYQPVVDASLWKFVTR